jgi:hypothetical protein
LKEFWEIQEMREGAKGLIFALRKEDGWLFDIDKFFKKNPWDRSVSEDRT